MKTGWLGLGYEETQITIHVTKIERFLENEA
jgi:hypothetical protein